MPISTWPLRRSQYFAKRAFECVSERKGDKQSEYLRFARRFPTLIHSCGLVQALAFAQAKGEKAILDDLASVLGKPHDVLLQNARSSPASDYLVLSREALEAASWIKRYAEGLLKD